MLNEKCKARLTILAKMHVNFKNTKNQYVFSMDGKSEHRHFRNQRTKMDWNGWICYAQVAKSPSDHQGADIWYKSKRVFITKLELGLPPLPMQRLRRGAPSFGLQCFYREYSGKRVTKRGCSGWRTTDWLPSSIGLCVDFRLVFLFPQ